MSNSPFIQMSPATLQQHLTYELARMTLKEEVLVMVQEACKDLRDHAPYPYALSTRLNEAFNRPLFQSHAKSIGLQPASIDTVTPLKGFESTFNQQYNLVIRFKPFGAEAASVRPLEIVFHNAPGYLPVMIDQAEQMLDTLRKQMAGLREFNTPEHTTEQLQKIHAAADALGKTLFFLPKSIVDQLLQRGSYPFFE